MRLKHKIALITGGTSGIGEATAVLFAKEGAKVAITGRHQERGDGLAQRIVNGGGRAIFIRTDVRDAEECRRAVGETSAAFGHIDILFNNAGLHRGRMGFADRHKPEGHISDVEVRAVRHDQARQRCDR